MTDANKAPAQPVHTEPNPAGNWPYPYNTPDEEE